MAVFLGVDTGGTYTDAALIRDDRVIASAKSLTTRDNLALGVGRAVQAVLDQSGVATAQIALASLSTTLATNALVEGQGGRVALIFIGFRSGDVARQGLDEALRGDPVIEIAGGHNHAGAEAAALDLGALREQLKAIDEGVTGYAVAGVFSTRNPAHEIAARDLIREMFDKPVSCSHELSAKLGGPKRAMTAVLNARLIGMIDQLIGAAQQDLADRGIAAEMMVVRGDGALISAAQARQKPIETILSGPAASIVGAHWLTGAKDAMVSDIGGTTTDVALLRGGKPMIDPDGARVGGLRTMVEAVAMRTFGLGGDSEVHMITDGLQSRLFLGPRRVVPVSLLAVDHGDYVHEVLERQLGSEVRAEGAGRFVFAIKGRKAVGLEPREATVYDRLSEAPIQLKDAVQNRLEANALDRLVARGLVMYAGLTPSDAAHQLGLLADWDGAAAEKALRLFAAQRTGAGLKLAPDAQAMAELVLKTLTEQSGDVVMEAAFAEEGEAIDPMAQHGPAKLARHVLTHAGQRRHADVVAIRAGLNLPLIGLGASARSYYGAVADRLGCEAILPEHGGVANAIGAVVGQITMRETGEVEAAGEGAYRAFLAQGPVQFAAVEDAIAAMRDDLVGRARAAAQAAGAQDVQTDVEIEREEAEIEGTKRFIRARVMVAASGRPRIT